MNRLTDIKTLIQEIENALKQKFPINQIQQGWQVLTFYGLSDSLYNSTMQKINEFEKNMVIDLKYIHIHIGERQMY